jgi:hypothetical protein
MIGFFRLRLAIPSQGERSMTTSRVARDHGERDNGWHVDAWSVADEDDYERLIKAVWGADEKDC